jgi:nucleotide-binding universal stress UspA family protein
MKALHISPGVVSTLVEASNDAHMIVVGSRGPHRFAKPGLGVLNSGLLHHAHCPVAIIHEPESPDHEIRADSPVLVDVDGSPASEAATALAFDEASRRRAPLVALHAWSDVGVPVLGMDWRVYRRGGPRRADATAGRVGRALPAGAGAPAPGLRRSGLVAS